MRRLTRMRATLLGPLPLSRERAIGASERLSAVTTLTSSLEYISQRRETYPGGLNDWAVARRNLTRSTPLTKRLLNTLARPRVTLALHIAQAGVSAGLLLPGRGRWRGAGSLFLGVTAPLLNPRHHYGTDGSDQVSVLVHLTMGSARLVRSPETKDALLWFAALQASLCYLASGWTKVMGRAWRDSSALPGVMRTQSYGHRPTFELIRRFPKTAAAAGYGVLALECLFPLVYAGRGRLARPLIGAAASFHLGTGVLMGLGRFTSGFIALHPSVAYTSMPRSHPLAAHRDDRMVGAVALGLGALLTAAAVGTVQRRLRTLDGWTKSRSVTSRHGNTLQHEIRTGAPDRPVVVLVNGLGSTSEQFGWFIDTLVRDSDLGVVSYARAGYAGSRRAAPGPYALQESVDDLVDLVGAVAPGDRQVVLVGHSLGGEIARRAALELGGRVRGVVYLDPAHPGELNGINVGEDVSRGVSRTLRGNAWALRLGTGPLMERPPWLAGLPAYFVQHATTQYTDARLWSAALREWETCRAEFSDWRGPLRPQTAPAMVFSARDTVDRDPAQLPAHQEIAAAHRAGGATARERVVEGSDHNSLLADATTAVPLAHELLEFIASAHGGASHPGPDQGAACGPHRPSTGEES